MTAYIGDAIFNILSNDTDVAAIVGDKIEPLRTRQEETPPFMIYRFTDDQPTDTKDGASTLDTDRLEIVMYSLQSTELNNLGAAVRAALDRYTGTNSGINIDKIIFDDKDSGFDNEAQLYRLDHIYRIRRHR